VILPLYVGRLVGTTTVVEFESDKPELVSARSAVPDCATVVWTIAELLFRFGSLVPDAALITSLMTVPVATPVFTATVTVNVVEPAFAMSGFVQEMVPVPPTLGTVGQVHPELPGKFKDWKVVFVGIVSLNVAFKASSGPLLVTVCV
jgi:hypothetical protein